MVLLANRGWTRLPKGNYEYRAFHQDVKIRKDGINTGKGYSSGVKDVVRHSAPSSAWGSSLVRCPGNIIFDISRLKVLVGGKRAGNNSAEIINEAADICRWLFQGGIDVYRELIDELVHGFDDPGVYSD